MTDSEIPNLTTSVKPHLIGIAGGTASGKTTLTRKFLSFATSSTSDVLELDSYYKAQDHKPFSERVKNNYDHPDAFEFELLSEQLNDLKNGLSISVPLYDFSQHNRKKDQSRTIIPKQIIFVEGILTLTIPEVAKHFDTTIFVDAPDDIRLARRLDRDVKERGRTKESVLLQWEETVHPMHQRFCAPCKANADFVVDGTDFSIQKLEALWSLVLDRVSSTS